MWSTRPRVRSRPRLSSTQPGVLPPAEAGVGVSLAGEFSTLPGIDPNTGLPYVLGTVGQIPIRVTATDAGGLSVTSTFIINVLPPNSPPVAVNDSYSTIENFGLTTLPSQSVLHNDVDPNADPFTAAVVTGPAHGTLTFNPNGTFVYVPDQDFTGTDSFTYVASDAGGTSPAATVMAALTVGEIEPVPVLVAGLAQVTALVDQPTAAASVTL